VVEFQPSKLAVVGSNPIARSSEDVKRDMQKIVWVAQVESTGSRLHFTEKDAHVAQLVEHVLGKDEVTRSIRVVGSTLFGF
jgi:hypothetical protein